MVVADEAGRFAMDAADEIKEEGTELIRTIISDPPETGGVTRTDK